MKYIKVLAIPVIALILCGCTDKECVESHIEPRIMVYPGADGRINQIIIPQVVCDEYAINEEKDNGK